MAGSFWLTAGPFGIQASRIGLYAFFFFAGAIVGADRVAAIFARHWLRWPLLAVLATALLLAADRRSLPDWVDGGVMVVFATAMAVGLLALAVRFGRRHTAIGDSLSANAYGIYVLHWPIVLWVQLALVLTPFGAVTKGLLAIVAGFGPELAGGRPAPCGSGRLTGSVKRSGAPIFAPRARQSITPPEFAAIKELSDNL